MTYALGFLGFGNMAQAICTGMLKSSEIDTSTLAFSQRSDEHSKKNALKFGIKHLDIETLLVSCDTLVLAIKPQQLDEVSPRLLSFSGHTLISLLAGTSIKTLAQYLPPSVSICRSMPNTPALLGQGLTGLSFSASCDRENRKKIESLFNTVGKSIVIDEVAMDALTAVSGSGPAFIYKMADAIAKTAAKNNLEYDLALQAIAQTLIGSGHMLLDSHKTPEELIQNVRSPKGTTAAGLDRLENSDFSSILSSVIQAAIDRSKQLGAL
jgi:pyrroline-5-carboxylate reductase